MLNEVFNNTGIPEILLYSLSIFRFTQDKVRNVEHIIDSKKF